MIYHSGPEHAAGIRAMCQALALLRPRIPVGVLVSLCGVPALLVRSFAADLHGSLLADGDTLQFLNEPTETWFRSRFRPEGDALRAFVRRLLPLASGSGYVATSLPQLMWESGDFDELVRLALTGEALPAGNDIERQQVAQQRGVRLTQATWPRLHNRCPRRGPRDLTEWSHPLDVPQRASPPLCATMVVR